MAAEPSHSITDPIPLRIVDYLDPAFVRLDELETLGYGWDSYDAEPVASLALRTARGLLILSVERVRQSLDAPYALSVVPIADGGVQIEWHTISASLEVEGRPDGVLDYLIENHESNRVEEGFDVRSDEILKALDSLSPSSAIS